MNILIIDNGTIRINNLKTLLTDNTHKVIKLGEINHSQAHAYDLIILSGSSKFPIIGNEILYKNEINLIKNNPAPILGICLGFELIAFAFGAKLEIKKEKMKGIREISILDSGEIFKDLPNFSVYESHRWIVKNLPEDFIALAESRDGFEVIKHKNRNIYGFQFHPSIFTNKTSGDEIFNNLLNVLNTK